MAFHRLGRLTGSTHFLICGLVGYAIDETANPLRQFCHVPTAEFTR